MNNRIGEKYITNEGYKIEIIEYFGWKNCTIQFDNGTIIRNIRYSHIKNGNVKNPNHKSVCNVGYMGVGKYKSTFQKKPSEYYNCWTSMIKRGYSSKYEKRQPSYKNVTVCEGWHNFQNFAEWFEENYKEGFELDKDILVKGNKLYSPETCCFVSKEINTLFTKNNSKRGDCPIGVEKCKNGKYRATFGQNNKTTHIGTFNTTKEAFEAYKTTKELYIKELANKWKDKINPKVYEAMYNYKVEITD